MRRRSWALFAVALIGAVRAPPVPPERVAGAGRVSLDGRTVRVEGVGRFSWDGPPCGHPGARIQVSGPVRAARDPASDGAWTEAWRWRFSGVIGGLSAAVCRIDPDDPWRHWARARARVAAAIGGAVSEPGERSVLSALALGTGFGPTPPVRSLLAGAGLAHLMAVSGLHVGLVAGALYTALTVLLRGWSYGLQRWGARRPAAAMAAVGTVLYVLWVGAGPSAVRAGIMGCLVFAARALACPPGATIPWALAGCAAVEPGWLFGPGLQLSFVALFGLRAFSQQGVPRWVSAGWGATAATAPLTAFWFGMVAPWGLLSTALVAPVVSLLLVPAVLVGVVLELGLGDGEDVFRAASFPARWLLTAAQLFAGLPGADVWVDPSRAPLLGVAMVLHLFGLRACRARPAALGVVVGVLALAATDRVAGVHIAFLPVGHGDAAVLRSGRFVAVIDVGPEPKTRSVVIPFLKHHGVQTIDVLVLTHDDADHVGGADALRSRAREVWSDPRARREARFSDGRLKVLVGSIPPGAGDNDLSLVVDWRSPGCLVLFTGDVERPREALLPAARADVLKVPHHGSDSSSSPRLLQAVSPRHAIISVQGGRYGLPSPGVIERLRAHGAAVHRTDHHGQIDVTCRGGELRLRRRLPVRPRAP